MTKNRIRTGIFPASALAAALLLALSPGGVRAQGARPADPPRLVMPALGGPASAPPAGASSQRQADFIVAVVNSEPITNSEVRSKLARTEQQMQQQGIALPPRGELVPQLLERMINDKAQLQMARTSGVKVDDNAVDAAVQTVARQNQIDVEELRRRLRSDGIDYSQFRSEIRDELLVSRLRQREVESRVTVSEQEIDQYLRDRDGKAGAAVAAPGATALNLAEILIAVPENATPAQLAALENKAGEIMRRARSGGDFSALAKEFSAAVTRGDGGQMGLRGVDRYPPLFVEATQNLRAGELAGPVRSGAGFHILKVIEKRQSGGIPDAVVTQTHARHILLRLTPQLSEAAAAEKLAGFRRRILAGQADFAGLARENSQDGSAKEGGDLGWSGAGSFVPEFEKVMNSLAPGEVSEPLVSRFGVHLVQVLERREAPITLRDQREMVRGLLREKKQSEAYALWAQEVRGRAYVELRENVQ